MITVMFMMSVLMTAMFTGSFVWMAPHFWDVPGLNRRMDCVATQDQLVDVHQVQSTEAGAFAAIRRDGSVIAWGDPYLGGKAAFS